MERCAGILLAISSLPSKYGIGDLGKNAYQFIDLLSQTKVSIWQILPLNPLAKVYAYSPYQTYSCFAGDEVYIDLEDLYTRGLLDSPVPSFQEDSKAVEYLEVKEYKEKYLRLAYKKFKELNHFNNYAFIDFVNQNTWLDGYAKFMAAKIFHEGKDWLQWPKAYQEMLVTPDFDFTPLQEDIEYYYFVEYIFYQQWFSLKQYANQSGIKIMGDIPIYVGLDSADVLQYRDCFLLDEMGNPTCVAGVPPDYFSPEGQRWGNPIYDWKRLKERNYDFWLERLRLNQKLFDIVRLDHFRAFDTYWTIPVESKDARSGSWQLGPAHDFFDTIFKQLPDIQIVAEDLGDLRQEVLDLRDYYHMYGMLITQFHINERNEEDDFMIPNHVIVYTGTHDNQTIEGWFALQEGYQKEKIYRIIEHLQCKEKNVSHSMIHYSLASPSDISIIPMQDILSLDDLARMNVPSTQGSPNWQWKLKDYEAFKKEIAWLENLIKQTNR